MKLSKSTGRAAGAVIAIAIGLILSFAGGASIARAQVGYDRGDEKRLQLYATDAAGANGQPLVAGLDRARVPFLTFDTWNARIGGHIEGSYTYNLDPFTQAVGQGGEVTTFEPRNAGRLFDVNSEDPTLNQVDLFAARDVDESWRRLDVGFKIEAMYGADASKIHSNGLFDHYQLVRVENIATGTIIAGSRIPPYEQFDPNGGPENQFDLPQGYVDITLPVGNGARIRLGKIASPFGLETIDPTTTLFLSRSFLTTFAQPRTVSGAWGAYRLAPEWWTEVGVHRGWEQSLEDNNAAHNYWWKLNWQTRDRRTAAALVIDSGPPKDDTSSSWRSVLDLTAVTMISDDGILLGGEILYGYQPNGAPGPTDPTTGQPQGTRLGTWFGAAGYVSFPLTNYLTANGRAEYLHDGRGALGINSDLYSLTGGAAIKPFPANRYGRGLVLRPEVRWDISPDKLFQEGKNNQWTIGIDLIYAF